MQLAVPAARLLGQQRDEGRVEVARRGALLQLRRSARRQHAAGVHRGEPAEDLGLLHVGGRHHHRHAGPPLADAIDELPELAPRERIHAGGGLVEHEQLRVVDQRAAEAELLLHAARELPGRALAEARQTGGREQLVDLRLALGARVPEQAAEEVDVLEHRERRVEVLAEPLRHVGDPIRDLRAEGALAEVAAQHLDGSGLDRARAGHEAEQRRLADAVGPDQPRHAAGRDLEVDAVERERLPVPMGDGAEPRGGAAIVAHSGGSRTARCSGHSPAPARRT